MSEERIPATEEMEEAEKAESLQESDERTDPPLTDAVPADADEADLATDTVPPDDED